MKSANYFCLVVLTCCLFAFTSSAQKVINELTLNYQISIETVNEKSAQTKSLNGADLTIYIKGTESRADMKNSLGTESNLYDSKTGKGVILKEYSGQKLLISMNRENWAQKNLYSYNLKFSLDNTDQEIAGYKCKKATATLESGKTFVVYYMADMVIANREYNNSFKNLPGIPVQYEQESGNLKFKYTLTAISYENIPGNKFEIPKTGFRVMTYEENQQLKKG